MWGRVVDNLLGSYIQSKGECLKKVEGLVWQPFFASVEECVNA